MYRKFDVMGNLLFAQYFFFEEVNTASMVCVFLKVITAIRVLYHKMIY
jgi:hypothetical protein